MRAVLLILPGVLVSCRPSCSSLAAFLASPQVLQVIAGVPVIAAGVCSGRSLLQVHSTSGGGLPGVAGR